MIREHLHRREGGWRGAGGSEDAVERLTQRARRR
jgi:hypothetical protein